MSRPDRAPRSVVLAFLLSALGAAGFAASYVLDLGNEALGGCLGAAFAFLALGLARWSSLIEGHEPDYVEERAVGPTPKPQYDAFRRALTEQPVPRSGVLWGALGTAVAAIGGAALFPLRSLLPSMGTDPDDVLMRTPWQAGTRLVTEEGEPIRPDDLEVGGAVTAFPEGLDPREHVDTTTMLIRVDPAVLRLPAGRQDWVVAGVVAYSKLCTHAGCPVGLYTDSSRELMCPCHHSVFDVTDGARPVEGPAPHPLPQLPLGSDESGYLVARGDFSGPVGPGWGNH
ncbi:ubiquinol-cytochrome c reductase iron-sulfur subunit [Nocardioides cheoyonin]|uniref:ubiquinol-cytochrome c reductase iron-sulfur subunit n=1 Tax=Nocardioides cheoyonin TaxID=3156615 RepID=UPI0032B560EF